MNSKYLLLRPSTENDFAPCEVMTLRGFGDMPIGDPNYGPMSGRKDMPFVTVAILGATFTLIEVAAIVLTVVAIAVTAVGAITGDAGLMKIGGYIGMAAGVAGLAGLATAGLATGASAASSAATSAAPAASGATGATGGVAGAAGGTGFGQGALSAGSVGLTSTAGTSTAGLGSGLASGATMGATSATTLANAASNVIPTVGATVGNTVGAGVGAGSSFFDLSFGDVLQGVGAGVGAMSKSSEADQANATNKQRLAVEQNQFELNKLKSPAEINNLNADANSTNEQARLLALKSDRGNTAGNLNITAQPWASQRSLFQNQQVTPTGLLTPLTKTAA
jgi:hypothetical protein